MEAIGSVHLGGKFQQPLSKTWSWLSTKVEMGSRPGAANRADRTFNAPVGPDRLRVPIYGWIWFCTPVRRNLPRRVGTREYIKYNRGPFDAVCTRIGVSNSWRRSRHVSATWK